LSIHFLDFLVFSFLLAFPPIIYMYSSSPPCFLHALSISSSLFLAIQIVWRRAQVMKLLTMRCSPASCHFIPLRSKYSSQQSVLETLTLCKVR
jgi:hypothetical protein